MALINGKVYLTFAISPLSNGSDRYALVRWIWQNLLLVPRAINNYDEQVVYQNFVTRDDLREIRSNKYEAFLYEPYKN